MKYLKLAMLFLCLIGLAGCLGNTGSEPTIITESSSKSYFYIANQSDVNLDVTYEMAAAYSGRDSTVAAPADSTTKIFEPGDIGSFPTPSEALASIRFYNQSGDMVTPAFTVKPVADTDWNNVTAEDDTVRKYELIVTKENLQ